MATENAVVFKGTREGITVILDPQADFELIKYRLAQKSVEAAGFFEGYKSAIKFTGRELSPDEKDELIAIIRQSSKLNISFVFSEDPEAVLSAGRIPALQEVKNMTKFHHGALRSGQEIDYKGSVVVVGDVNPGAVVRAGENIIVLGSLKGTVHAGLSGSFSAFVFAVDMSPIQLRIR
ncbi:MAG: septum site-determining protein MinC, partial [Firmicutes bacterium]|nr:septum site-determining protein MinC [Bacillota bacterium]